MGEGGSAQRGQSEAILLVIVTSYLGQGGVKKCQICADVLYGWPLRGYLIEFSTVRVPPVQNCSRFDTWRDILTLHPIGLNPEIGKSPIFLTSLPQCNVHKRLAIFQIIGKACILRDLDIGKHTKDMPSLATGMTQHRS